MSITMHAVRRAATMSLAMACGTMVVPVLAISAFAGGQTYGKIPPMVQMPIRTEDSAGGIRALSNNQIEIILDQRSRDCDASAGSFSPILYDILQNKKTNGQEFRAKSLDFSRDCLDTVDKITDPAIATAYKQIKPSLGVVYDKYEKRYMCNATIIAPTRILTARHCFFKGSTARKKDALLFFTTSQPETPIPILGMAPEFDTDAFGLHNQANDYVVAVLSSSASTAGWQQFSDKVTWFTNLLIIAGDFNSLNIRHGRSGQAGRTDAIGAEWVNFLSYTPPSTCMVTKLQGDFCMAHACQTIPGMSGAGIFSMAGRVPQLIAVHIGTTYEDQRENSSVCHRDGLGTAVAAAQTNTGRRLDRRAIERIQKSIP